MNAESKDDKDYTDYVRDAQALRARNLTHLASSGWRRVKGLSRSYRRRLTEATRLTRNWQG